jgi:hypothetical protein
MRGTARLRLLSGAGGFLRLAAAVVVAAGLAATGPHAVAGVDKPVLLHGKGDHCVAPIPYIRRYHPDLLKHHRDVVVHEGIRTKTYNLTNCIECHANPKTGSVASSKDDFCVSCHDYAGIKLDCWGCHSPKLMKPEAPAPAISQDDARPIPSPMLAGVTQ